MNLPVQLDPRYRPEDEAFFFKLPDRVKDDVWLLQDVFSRVFAAEQPIAMCHRIGAELSIPGMSGKTLEHKYYQIREGASWRVFVNCRKLRGELRTASTRSHMTPAVIEEWWSECLKNQRKFKPAYRALVRRYRNGERIGDISWVEVWKDLYPDLEVPARIPPAMALPRGWSYDNFMQHQPRKRTTVAARIGAKAAATYNYQVHTTRVGLHVGEALVFDDVWHDILLNFPNQTVAVRPLELGGADILSGYKLEPGFRPRRVRLDGKRDGLNEGDMRFYLAHVLCNVGVYRGGCTLYAEHGTAAVREPLEKLLNQYSKVPIRVQRSDIEGVRQYAQLYSGKGGGNPRLKAGYESLHNLTHNETGALPAQTGRDRVEPESLYGLKDINTKLLIACYAMTPARASLIRFPAMSWDAGVEAIRSAYYNMNRREDHDLEGWRDAGFVKEQFRLGPNDHWRNRAELERIPADKRAVVEAFIAHPDYHRTVYMSPWDVWKSGQGDLVRLPKHCLFLICGADLGVVRECPPTDQIVFESQSVEPGPMIYETRYTDLEGREIRLEEGEEYRWLINPFDARQMFVGRLDGGYLGMCRRCDRPSKVDIQGLEQEFKTASKREAEAAREAIAINRRLIEQRIEDARHNAAVLAGEAVLPEEVFEKAADARKRKALARFKPDPLVEDDAGGGQEPAAVAVGVEEGGAELEIGNLL